MDQSREISSHLDGHGLNDRIRIFADAVDPNAGGASHNYTVVLDGQVVATINYQHGPRLEANSTPGITDAVLLAIVADRMACFNAGPYACRENALVRTHVELAMHWERARADDRAKRGVLGKNEK